MAEIDYKQLGEVVAEAIRQNYRDTSFASPSELEESVEFVVSDDNVEWFINDYALFLNDGTEFIKGQIFIDNAPTEAENELEEITADGLDNLITTILG